MRLQASRPEEALEDTLKVLQSHPEDFLATCLKVGKLTSSSRDPYPSLADAMLFQFFFLAQLLAKMLFSMLIPMAIGRGPGPNGLALTPPMGWMSWEIFRCETDCSKHPNSCINDELYLAMADRIAADGYLSAGYNQVSIDGKHV